MSKKIQNKAKNQLDLNFKNATIKQQNNFASNQGAKIVKLDPNQELYKRILNRKSQ